MSVVPKCFVQLSPENSWLRHCDNFKSKTVLDATPPPPPPPPQPSSDFLMASMPVIYACCHLRRMIISDLWLSASISNFLDNRLEVLLNHFYSLNLFRMIFVKTRAGRMILKFLLFLNFKFLNDLLWRIPSAWVQYVTDFHVVKFTFVVYFKTYRQMHVMTWKYISSILVKFLFE